MVREERPHHATCHRAFAAGALAGARDGPAPGAARIAASMSHNRSPARWVLDPMNQPKKSSPSVQILGVLLNVLLSACSREGAPLPDATPASSGRDAPSPLPPAAPSPLPPGPAATPAPVHPEAAPSEEVRIEEYTPEGAFVLRGSRAKGHAVLFGGQCAQPQGYADAIKIAAARRVQLVTLRGDKPCTGEYRGWLFDLDALSRRIDRTFRALGLGEPRDVLLIGYSQGASVAELLLAREPDRFTRAVLIAKPSRPESWHFKRAKAVVTMAGTRDAQAPMIQGSRSLSAAGVRSRYFPLPGAVHGDMGDDPEGTFEQVLTWLYDDPA